MLWCGVGCGDENGFAGKGQSEVGEHGLEGVWRQRDEADEKAAGGGERTGEGWGGGGGGDIGLRRGHRAMWTFPVLVCGSWIWTEGTAAMQGYAAI